MREVTVRRTDFSKLSVEVIGRGGAFLFKAHGSSMTPFIRNGDILVIEPVEDNSLHLGDILFYRSMGRQLVAHRLMEKQVRNDSTILTMHGDAIPDSGEQIRHEQVIGRVASVQRRKKVYRLDPNGRWAPRFSGYTQRFIFRLMRTAGRSVRWVVLRMQSLKPYRILSNKLIGEQVSYRVVTTTDASWLSRFHGYVRFHEREDPIEKFAEELNKLEHHGYIFAAYLAGRVAGAITARRFPENETLYPHWWLFGLTVRIRYRGAGIAGELVKMALKKASEYGALKMNVLVFEKNMPAIKLYTKIGFKPCAIPPLDNELENEVKMGQRRRIILGKLL